MSSDIMPNRLPPHPPGPTRLSAYGLADGEVISVVEGEDVEVPFGSLFHAEVVARSIDDEGNIFLSMKMYDSFGPICRSLSIKGRIPASSHFTITLVDENKVASGEFELRYNFDMSCTWKAPDPLAAQYFVFVDLDVEPFLFDSEYLSIILPSTLPMK